MAVPPVTMPSATAVGPMNPPVEKLLPGSREARRGDVRRPHERTRSRGRPRSSCRPCCRARRRGRPSTSKRFGAPAKSRSSRFGSCGWYDQRTEPSSSPSATIASEKRPQPFGDVTQLPVPTKTRPLAASTAGDDHTSPQPAPGRAVALRRCQHGAPLLSPVAASSASTPAGSPLGLLCTSQPTIDRAVDDDRRRLDLGRIVRVAGVAEPVLPAQLAVARAQRVEGLASAEVDGLGAADRAHRGRRHDLAGVHVALRLGSGTASAAFRC